MAAALELLTLHLFAVTQITVFTLPWLNSHSLMRHYAVTNWHLRSHFISTPYVHFPNFKLTVFWFPILLIGSKVRIFEFRHLIGCKCPNAALRIATCMDTKTMRPSCFSRCGLLTTIHPPLQDLRGIKLSQFRIFQYLKNLNKTPLY